MGTVQYAVQRDQSSCNIQTLDNCLTPCFSTWTPQICYTYLWNDACTLIGFERSDRSRVFRTVHCELVQVTATCTDICMTLLSYAYDNKKHY